MKLRVTETAFQRSVIELAQRLGWKVAHFRKAQNNRGQWRTPVAADGKGFPDLVLVRDRIIFAELKQDDKYPTPAQREWLDAINEATAGDPPPCERTIVETRVWRPRDWDAIVGTLTRKAGP